MLDHADHVVAFVDDYLHKALSSMDAVYVERHCDSCRICKLALEDARKRFAALETLPAIEPSEQLIQSTLQRIDVHDRRTRKVRRWFLGVSLPAVAASALVIGILHLYYLNLTPTPYDLRILGQSKLLAGSMASLRIRLVDRGAPVAGATVDVELRGMGENVKLASFTTNAEGTGEPRFRLPDWADGDYTLTVRADYVHDASGEALAADSVTRFFCRSGDSDGDGHVDQQDRDLFRSAFKTTAGEAGYRWYFDYDGDGAVDGQDNGQFNRRFGHP